MDQNKKTILTIVAIVVIAGFAYWGYKHGWSFKNLGKQQNSNNIKDLPITQVPPDMPQDIILPKDAKVLHSYTAVAPNGQNQSTLIYSTSESPGLLNKEYFGFFAKNNWGVQVSPASINATSTQMLSFDKQELVAVQEGKQLSIKISQSADSQWLVSLNLLIPAK